MIRSLRDNLMYKFPRQISVNILAQQIQREVKYKSATLLKRTNSVHIYPVQFKFIPGMLFVLY